MYHLCSVRPCNKHTDEAGSHNQGSFLGVVLVKVNYKWDLNILFFLPCGNPTLMM